MLENGKHLLQRVDTLLEILGATAFLGVLTLATYVGRVSDGHATDQRNNVGLGYEAIIVEIINFEDHFNLVIEVRTVEHEHSVQKLLFIKIIIFVSVKDSKQPLTQKAGQLAVIQHRHFVDAFVPVVGALL